MKTIVLGTGSNHRLDGVDHQDILPIKGNPNKMTKVAIVSVVYHERSWQETRKCVEACGVDTYFVERNPPGIGSLAEALNRGFQWIYEKVNPEYVWFVTNVTFKPSLLSSLIDLMDTSCWKDTAAVHPYFNSDHAHLRFKESYYVFDDVPFVEFTAPLVRADVFAKFLLDEKMPYVGFDMDWGYRLRRAGHTLSVSYEESFNHTYNRHLKKEAVTRHRVRLRAQAVPQTRKRLIELYGKDYATKLGYKGPL